MQNRELPFGNRSCNRTSGLNQTRRLGEKQRLEWLRLIRSDNVGPVTFRSIINRFGNVSNALEILPSLYKKSGNQVCPRSEAEKELARAEELGLRLVAAGEPEYPRRLFELDSAPPLLYVMGETLLLNRDSLAIVGSRSCSALGYKMTQMIASEIGEPEFGSMCVVSGLARGIDTVAHLASLRLGTVAVLAGGANIVYPPENRSLYERIRDEGGAIVAEMPPDFKPQGRHFPCRNRIIAGMTLGTLVTEAAIRSGSLITAQMALDAGREVFAIPGSPLDPRAAGTNALIRDGANLVRSAADISEVLRPLHAIATERENPSLPIETEMHIPRTAIGNIEHVTDDMYAAIDQTLSHSPTDINDIVRLARVPASIVSLALLEMELSGHIKRSNGSTFARI